MSDIKNNNNENSSENSEGFSKLMVFFLFLAILGLLGIITSNYLPKPYDHLFRDVAVTLSAISVISLIYENWLRKKFVDEMRTTVESVIRKQMPSQYKNVKNSGVEDIYENLDKGKIKRALKSFHNGEIRILKIFMSDMDDFEQTLLEAIENRNCTVKILLLDPNQKSAIEARAIAVPHNTHEAYVSHINMNLSVARSIYKKLSKEKKDKFEVKLHKSFIATSIIGYGETMIVGFYLQGRIATEGTQLKVKEATHFFYNELNTHFDEEWIVATSYIFEQEELKNTLTTGRSSVNDE